MISLSFIVVIIITAYVAYLCSTNRKTNPYNKPALKLKKSSSYRAVMFKYSRKLWEMIHGWSQNTLKNKK